MVNPNVREVVEDTQFQGVDEEIIYKITTTPWGGTPTSVSAVAKDSAGVDVSSTVFPAGSISVASDVITLKPLKALTAAKQYRIEVKFTSDSNILECWFEVQAET